MGEQELVAEADGFAALVGGIGGEREFDLRGDTAEAFEAGGVLRGEGEGDQRRAGRYDAKAELAGEIVTKASGAELGDGKAAGGDDECAGLYAGRASVCLEFEREFLARAGYGEDARAEQYFGSGALGQQHVDKLPGGAVAEELAWGFGVVGDAVSLD